MFIFFIHNQPTRICNLQVFSVFYSLSATAMRLLGKSRHALADGDMGGTRWRARLTPVDLLYRQLEYFGIDWPPIESISRYRARRNIA